MYSLKQNILLLYVILSCIATNTTSYKPKYHKWEKEWAPIYEQNKTLIQNPIALSSYFAKTVQEHANIHDAIQQLGLNQPFYFGASSSSYQVEGGIGDENSWTPFVRRQNMEIAHNAILFWEQYAKENSKKIVHIRAILHKWHTYKNKVATNSATTEDTLWAQAAWEFIYGNPNQKTKGFIKKLSNKHMRKNILSATEHKKIREFVGNAIDFWHKYPEDIALLKNEFGINAMRISIEWSRIQSNKTSWNEEALQEYKKMVQEMKNHGIEPIIVLHHYTIPTWFEALGGFTKHENIDYFVHFALGVYDALGDSVTLWSTFNAVEGYAYKGYWTLDGAPGLYQNMHTTQTVIAHMLESHVYIYRALKAAYKNRINKGEIIPNPQIGIQKNVLPLDRTSGWNLISRVGAYFGNNAQNNGYYSFFKTGRFDVTIPLKLGHFSYPSKNQAALADAPYCLDWIGINHYSNAYMKDFSKRRRETDPERMTLNPDYRFYPEGLYRSVEHIYHSLVKDVEHITGKKIPILITENGIAVGDNETRRSLFYQRALFTIAQTIKDGYTVIGYTPWSHADNYEWGSPYGKKRYGLLHVDFKNPQLTRTVKEGARYYATFVKNFFNQSKLKAMYMRLGSKLINPFCYLMHKCFANFN